MLVTLPNPGPLFTTYSLSRLQTCLFLLSEKKKKNNSKHPLCEDFFFSFFFPGLSCFSPPHAWGSPTNELNAEETWKRLDEARLSGRRGDVDVPPYDCTPRLHQQKQEDRPWPGSAGRYLQLWVSSLTQATSE